MKISGQIEQIFAHAVALDQSGGLKNTIYVIAKEVYILNYDHSVLIRFKLRETETPFHQSLSFKANDYDSNEFSEENGKIVFISRIKGYEKRKICGKSEKSPEEIKQIFSSLIKKEKDFEEITLSNKMIPLLDEDLSHIEFSGKKGNSMKMIQRNIYNGSIVEITEVNEGIFQNHLNKDFGPIGMKTKDFTALFSFQENLKFKFINDKEKDNFVIIKSIDKNKRDMTAIVAACLYDELIQIR